MCRVLGVSKSGFYRWINHALPLVEKAESTVKAADWSNLSTVPISLWQSENHCAAGSRRLACLRADSDPLYGGDGTAFEDSKEVLGHNEFKAQSAVLSESSGSNIHRQSTGGCMGIWHHIYSDKRRLAVFGDGDGPVFPSDYRLGDVRPHDERIGHSSFKTGLSDTAAKGRAHSSFRSRQSICVPWLSGVTAFWRQDDPYESERELLRQCLYWIIPQYHQERTDPSWELSEQRYRKTEYFGVYCQLL